MYKMQYIVRPDDVETASIYTEIGSRVHDALESFYLSPEEGQEGHYPHPYPALLDHWKRDLEAWKMSGAFDELVRISADVSHLEARCSPNYKGKDAIRNRDGSVPKNPAMTGAYKEAMAALKIDSRKASIDRAGAAANDLWKGFSLTDTFAQSSVIIYPYQHPTLMQDVLFIEFPISDPIVWAADDDGNLMKDANGEPVLTSRRQGPYPVWVNPETGRPNVAYIVNPVYLPDGSLFNGYIDIVARDERGRIILGDHKTSQKKPGEMDVKRHQQLLMYAWAWHQLTGEWPALIGINHLRSGSFIPAEVDQNFAQQVVLRHMTIVDAIDKKVFVCHDPHGFGAPCLDYRTGEPACAYFKHCHPELWKEMTAVPEDTGTWDPFFTPA